MIPGVEGTLWGAYNGVTEYIDHGQKFGSLERNVASIWFEDGYLRKARAYETAVAKLNEWRN
jgi:hypothetical protein